MVVGDDFIVVSISGVTNGGKSLLVAQLKKELPEALFINQDDYFISEEDSKHEWLETKYFRHQNWEIPSAINFQPLKEKVKSLTLSGCGLSYRLLLIEGHLLFSDAELAKWSDRKYFFTLTKDQCWQRRKGRTYNPPDPPKYFEICVFPEYMKHRKFVEEHIKDVQYIDGARPQELTFQEILSDIRQLLLSQRQLSPAISKPNC